MGPLEGTRVVDLGGIGPAAWGSMLLADLGAEVVRIERPRGEGDDAAGQWSRGQARLELDLKDAHGRDRVLAMIDRCDALIEGFRPGVAERLGLGPDVCLERNPRLVYGRITGWGQEGPYAARAGHDINYIGVSGVLDTLGRRGDPPTVPLYYGGDWASGAMLLALGIVSALVERGRSQRGQVVDAAMVDGAVLMLGEVIARMEAGTWRPERGSNEFDTGASYYDTFETSDGEHMAVGAVEEKFYLRLLEALGLEELAAADRHDREAWPELKQQIAAVFATRTQREWCEVFMDVDASVTPVRRLQDAPADPHLRARGSFVRVGGRLQPAPAPRFGRTPCEIGPAPDVAAVLARWGVAARA